MKNVMGIINLHENDDMLREMTRYRPLAAIPFAGRYRLIDFVLSNMINSGISNVGVLAKGNYRSLMDHLRSGKEWDLARKRDGLFILPSVNGSLIGEHSDLHDLHNNLDYLKSSRQPYVLMSGSHILGNLDYRPVYEAHLAKKADVTLLYKDYGLTGRQGISFEHATMIEVDDDDRVVDIEICPVRPKGNKMSLEMFLIDRRLLIDLVDSCLSRGGSSVARDCLMKNLESLRFFGYSIPGYVARIHSVESYFRRSMDLLNPEIWQELFFENGAIYTKVKDEAPAKYQHNADVRNSMVANGCVISGNVENSILFRGVKVHPDARVVNSIVMQKGEISAGAVVENVICDKDVRIMAGKKLRGEVNHPIIIEKGTVI
ncbi:MAG TPA: glucose-1-phosphate adenylyltransferase subunit GlgD [Patescibacteria group bacterium]|nr:glucose-1-phosphate adenylyltransferase subunit GlgD [Patescibacteria group bacterium]